MMSGWDDLLAPPSTTTVKEEKIVQQQQIPTEQSQQAQSAVTKPLAVMCYICGKDVEVAKSIQGKAGTPIHKECQVQTLQQAVENTVQTPTKPATVSANPAPIVSSAPIVADEFAEKGYVNKKFGEVYMLYGDKGDGKTVVAMSFPGTITNLCFDRKADPVKENFFSNNARINVVDCIKWMDWSSEEKIVQSGDKTYRYVLHVLEGLRSNPPDWIIIDASDRFQYFCELTMRYRNNLLPSEGIVNRNLWKQRKQFVTHVHNLCLEIAKKGLIYTAYSVIINLYRDGEINNTLIKPKWLDVLILETDTVIRVENRVEKGGSRRFFAIVESSKTKLPTGIEVDVTGRGYAALEEKMLSIKQFSEVKSQ